MKIICIFGQRKESYKGEYAPELLAAIDEYGDDSNPDSINDEMKKTMKRVVFGEFEFIRRITIEIDDKSFDRIFFGEAISANCI